MVAINPTTVAVPAGKTITNAPAAQDPIKAPVAAPNPFSARN
ncbi:MAG: hypothetical protein ACOYK1_05070 [Vampirovibrionia bacterium]|jgi:hypothetical protein